MLQSWLAASGRARRHRALGLVGVSLATLVTVTAILAGINRGRIFIDSGAPAPVAWQFTGSIVLDALLFATLFTLAVVYAKDAPTHRRIMMIATIANLGAAMNRVFRYVGTELAASVHLRYHLELPILLTDLLVMPLLIHDLRTNRRLHPANIAAIGGLLFIHLIRVPLFESGFSQSIGAYTLRLVGPP